MTHKILVNILEVGDDEWQKPFVRFEIPTTPTVSNAGKQFDIHFSDRETVKALAQHLYKKATITIEVVE